MNHNEAEWVDYSKTFTFERPPELCMSPDRILDDTSSVNPSMVAWLPRPWRFGEEHEGMFTIVAANGKMVAKIQNTIFERHDGTRDKNKWMWELIVSAVNQWSYRNPI